MLTVEALLDEKWEVTKSGVSVDAGKVTRIRQENVGPRDELAARARLISIAPDGYRLAQAVVDIDKNLQEGWTGDVKVPEAAWRVLASLASRVLLKTDAPPPSEGKRSARKEAIP